MFECHDLGRRRGFLLGELLPQVEHFTLLEEVAGAKGGDHRDQKNERPVGYRAQSGPEARPGVLTLGRMIVLIVTLRGM